MEISISILEEVKSYLSCTTNSYHQAVVFILMLGVLQFWQPESYIEELKITVPFHRSSKLTNPCLPIHKVCLFMSSFTSTPPSSTGSPLLSNGNYTELALSVIMLPHHRLPHHLPTSSFLFVIIYQLHC